MTIKTTLRSIKNKGLRRFIRDYRRRKSVKRHRSAISDDLDYYNNLADSFGCKKEMSLEQDTKACLDLASFVSKEKDVLKDPELFLLARPIARLISENCENLMNHYSEEAGIMLEVLWDLEKTKRYNRYIKSVYIKELYPSIYLEYSKEPVKDKLIMMESGRAPSPSSKHLSEVLEEDGKYKILYIGLRIREVPFIVFYENGVELIRELATAKALFLSTANDLLSHIDVRPETKVIQLWHGVGAFKHVGHSTVNNSSFGRSQEQWCEYDSYRNYDAVTIASEGQRWIFRDSMQLEDSKILPIGVARTDVFYDRKYHNDSLESLYERFPQIQEKKIILYAPTFRGAVGKGLAPDKLDIRALSEKLRDDYVLIIKHHGLSGNIPPIPEGLEDSFAFDLNKHAVLDIDRLLVVSDILITDYSSVAFEYAITERPIIFFAYDLEDYIEQRGLYFDFEKDAPGPLCRDTESIIDYIINIDKRFDKEKLLKFKHEYVDACDGHATERTIALIEQ